LTLFNHNSHYFIRVLHTLHLLHMPIDATTYQL
uniref:Transposase n=1 Tax=Haemonchus placei TaxID=6290 RepID=A0A0N4W7F0_HAEPC